MQISAEPAIPKPRFSKVAAPLTVLAPAASTLALTADDTKRLSDLFDRGTSPNTRRAITADLAFIETWYRLRHGEPMPLPVPVPAVVRLALDLIEGPPVELDAALVAAGLKRKVGPYALGSARRKLFSLATVHRVQGLEPPTRSLPVREVLRKASVAAAREGRTVRRADALTLDKLERLLAATEPHSAKGCRDRALLLTGWAAGGRRRSELAELRLGDLAAESDGYLWRLSRSKTDQDGTGGLTVPVLGRAGAALSKWLATVGLLFGQGDRRAFVFRRVQGPRIGHSLTPNGIGSIVKALASKARMGGAISAHSIRAGFITESGRAGVPLAEAMALSGHRTASVALAYYRPGDAVSNRAARLAG